MPARPVALVMAASRGLGLASALNLATTGHPVAICGRNAADVDKAVIELQTHTLAHGIVADISDPKLVEHVVAQTKSTLGPIGILVANGGGPPAGGFFDVSTADWHATHRLTLMSVVNAVNAVVPDMRTAGFGRIIVIGSSSIRRPIQNLVLSNTFRAAVNGLVKDLAVGLAPDGITVNMVAPGRIDTDRVRRLDAKTAERQGISPERARHESESSIPMRRYGCPAEFAAVVAFLASQSASYVTGQSILVDGGSVASLP